VFGTPVSFDQDDAADHLRGVVERRASVGAGPTHFDVIHCSDNGRKNIGIANPWSEGRAAELVGPGDGRWAGDRYARAAERQHQRHAGKRTPFSRG
jgi:hypothetical protein